MASGEPSPEASEPAAGAQSVHSAPMAPGPALKRRFYGVVTVEPSRHSRDAAKVAPEIVAHLDGLVGTDLKVTIEISATNPDGFPERVRKIVEENADALHITDRKLEQS